MLLKSQKNDLLRIISSNGLEPYNFIWTERYVSYVDSSKKVISLDYKDTEYYFTFDLDSGRYYCFFSPGYKIIEDYIFNTIWDSVVEVFVEWIGFLKDEISQPDLWDEIRKYNFYTEFNEITDGNEPFNVVQAKQIQNGIEAIRSYLIEQVQSDQENVRIINEKMDYLVNSIDRMGKVDWKNIFVGAMVNLSITLALDPEQAKTIISIFKTVIDGAIKLLG